MKGRYPLAETIKNIAKFTKKIRRHLEDRKKMFAREIKAVWREKKGVLPVPRVTTPRYVCSTLFDI